MKRKVVFLYLLTLILLTGLTSCVKETGCTDPDSPRYNDAAEKDDGTCESSGDFFSGNWTVSEKTTLDASIANSFDVTITKIDDNTITIKQDTISPNYYSISEMEVNTEWQPKTIEGTSNNNGNALSIEGTITNENELEIMYEVRVGFHGEVDTTFWNLSR